MLILCSLPLSELLLISNKNVYLTFCSSVNVVAWNMQSDSYHNRVSVKTTFWLLKWVYKSLQRIFREKTGGKSDPGTAQTPDIRPTVIYPIIQQPNCSSFKKLLWHRDLRLHMKRQLMWQKFSQIVKLVDTQFGAKIGLGMYSVCLTLPYVSCINKLHVSELCVDCSRSGLELTECHLTVDCSSQTWAVKTRATVSSQFM